MEFDLQAVLDVTLCAAREAGTLLKRSCGKIGVEKSKSCAQDIVTLTDVQCQELIRACFHRHLPSFKLLGEEDVPPGSAASKAALESILASSSW